jgi:hypothetical protein
VVEYAPGDVLRSATFYGMIVTEVNLIDSTCKCTMIWDRNLEAHYPRGRSWRVRTAIDSTFVDRQYTFSNLKRKGYVKVGTVKWTTNTHCVIAFSVFADDAVDLLYIHDD